MRTILLLSLAASAALASYGWLPYVGEGETCKMGTTTVAKCRDGLTCWSRQWDGSQSTCVRPAGENEGCMGFMGPTAPCKSGLECVTPRGWADFGMCKPLCKTSICSRYKIACLADPSAKCVIERDEQGECEAVFYTRDAEPKKVDCAVPCDNPNTLDCMLPRGPPIHIWECPAEYECVKEDDKSVANWRTSCKNRVVKPHVECDHDLEYCDGATRSCMSFLHEGDTCMTIAGPVGQCAWQEGLECAAITPDKGECRPICNLCASTGCPLDPTKDTICRDERVEGSGACVANFYESWQPEAAKLTFEQCHKPCDSCVLPEFSQLQENVCPPVMVCGISNDKTAAEYPNGVCTSYMQQPGVVCELGTQKCNSETRKCEYLA